jgi:hypothetical protein
VIVVYTSNVTVTGLIIQAWHNSTPQEKKFSNICPLVVNHHAATANQVPAGVTDIVPDVYIAKTPVTSFSAINFANAAAVHPLQNCRTFNHNNTAAAGGLQNAGYYRGFIVQPTGAVILQFLSAKTGFSDAFGDSQNHQKTLSIGYRHLIHAQLLLPLFH